MVYKQGPAYRVRPVEEICEDIRQARKEFGDRFRSLFLPAGNTIAMPTGELAAVCRYAREALPSIERITVYGSSQYILAKGAEGLKRLSEAGLSRIHVGLESGDDEVLRETRMLLEHLECTSRLTSDHYTNYINLEGQLPEDKDHLLGLVDQALSLEETRFRPLFVGTA
jgi:radical SAM superfamily enzyme YgiQ (UPF0313 family)